MQHVVIIVPVYKSIGNLSEMEVCSLRQLKAVLGHYPVCIVAAENFAVDDYVQYFNCSNIFTEKFKEYFFKDISSYNRLCLSRSFYERFLPFNYMLIYQLDAYVFRDDLAYWIKQGYDFIGAPFYQNCRGVFDEILWQVGNGGFSLRSVKKSYKLVSAIHFYRNLLRASRKLRCENFITKLLKKTGIIDLSLIHSIVLNRYNEDVVHGVHAKEIIKDFRVAPVQTAWRFSFEGNPSHLYQLNHNQLPFGCHGWDKYEPEFWEHFINVKN